MSKKRLSLNKQVIKFRRDLEEFAKAVELKGTQLQPEDIKPIVWTGELVRKSAGRKRTGC